MGPIVTERAPQHDEAVFDPSNPEQPLDEILGIDTDALLRLGSSATGFGVLPPEVGSILPSAEPMDGLQTSSNETAPEDVWPARRAIRNPIPGSRTVDRLAAGADAIEAARQNIEKIQREVEFVAQFENPKAQFVTELQEVADTAKQSIKAHQAERIRQGSNYELPPPPKGFFGFVTKVIRKIRSFFGIFKSKAERKSRDTEITAHDAAIGLDSTIRTLVSDRDESKQRYPILSNFVLDKIPLNRLPSIDQLAFMAPEILTSIFSALPKDKEDEKMLDSVKRNPQELRFITRYKRTYGPYYLDSIQHATRTLLPAIRDVLPTEGKQVRQTFEMIKSLLDLQPKTGTRRERTQDTQKPQDTQNTEKTQKLRDRIKDRLRTKVNRLRTA